MRRKINCLEGIRAIACVSIFWCHFKGSFLPEAGGVLMNTPFRIFFTGNDMVRILFTLSGFVISYKYFSNKKYESIPVDLLKRYFRFVPPIFIVNLLVFFMMKLGLYFNIQAAVISGSMDFLALFNDFTPDIRGCIKESLITCLFNGGNAYNGPLWTMTYEYLGTILILCAILVCKDNRIFRGLFYIVGLFFYSTYYNYFILGMLICDIYQDAGLNLFLKMHNGVNNVLFLFSSLLISMIRIDDSVKITRICFSIGLIIFFITLVNSSWSERVLGNKVMIKIGTLSYAIYLVHWPVIESFSSGLYIVLQNCNQIFSLTLIFVLTLVVVLCLAYVIHKYVEKSTNNMIEYINCFK